MVEPLGKNTASTDLLDTMLSRLMPTWLSLMSPNSKSWTVSNSTANRWFEMLPTSFGLRRPKYWLGYASVSDVEREMVKANPWPPSFGYWGMIANAKAVEKEKSLASLEDTTKPVKEKLVVLRFNGVCGQKKKKDQNTERKHKCLGHREA
ncbi:hypothetical protein CR513_40593, partial [Mucuna pruriens]